MTEKEDKEKPGRKSLFESLPSYLAGLAAVATATVAVLTYLHNRNVAVETPSTEPEVSHEHVTAVPSVEIAPSRTGPSGVVANGSAGRNPTQAAPTLESAVRPTRCASYIGTWKLSSGESLSLLANERAEVSGGTAPRFGRWACSGRDEEIFYLMLDRERSVTFDASGDGKTLYQRTDQPSATPLSATRTSGP
jgi:hypothetical protein